MKHFISTLLLVPILFSCQFQKKQNNDASATIVGKLWETDTLLTTAESAIFDSVSNVIFVSCINKQPRVKDGNGFISKVSTNGEITNLMWITGLDAPKGMGIYNGKLYVADIDRILGIDISKGIITDTFVFNDAKMLNDITIDKNGKIFVSDTDDNKIYTLDNANPSVLIDSGLQLPNGLYIEDERLLLASMGSYDVVAYTLTVLSKSTLADSIGRGDGLVSLKKDSYLVSDWSGEVFLIENGKRASVLKTSGEKINSADIGLIIDESIILIPTFNHNTLAAYKLNIP